MSSMTDQKKLVILAGPSGSGKTTVSKHLLTIDERLVFSISATTRQKRSNETDGKDYYFMTEESFNEKLAKDEFVETEQVYAGIWYGTLKSEMERIWQEGKVPMLDIDVYGALNIKKNYAPQALTVFIHPGSVETLIERLKLRATENEESSRKRIHRAEEELSKAPEFDRTVFNIDLEKALVEVEEIINEYIKG